ncbi:response regulator [Oceanobacter mangrovi]|uniref:response regulator n=1 Tax=Oceanobacter mangrovi TaxID=2862510 RepID=UPI001C8D1813|nr:response regulator [Oceanobacter mangrovi]
MNASLASYQDSHPASTTVTRVMVVDDHPLFRRGVVQLLNDSPQFEVVADMEDGRALIGLLQQQQPELVLLDLNMPQISGLELLQAIRAHQLTMKVVVITASEDDGDLFQALASGADGYLMKDTAPDEMITKLQQVLAGEVALNNHAVTLLAQAMRQSPLSANELAEPAATVSARVEDVDLTARERQTLMLIAQGLNNKLIARELGISDGTVKVYVKSLLRKLDLHSRLELAAWVHKHPQKEALEL